MRLAVLCAFTLALSSSAGAAEVPEKPILTLDAGGHTALVRKVLFTPDGRELITVSADKTIRVWDVASGEPLRVLRPPIGRGLEGMLYAAALSPDGRTLAVGGFGWTGGEQPIYLINLRTGRINRVLRGHTNVIFALAFAPDGRALASGSGDHNARLWNVATGQCTHVLQGHTNDIHGVAFSPDGRRLATASFDTTGRIWSVFDGRAEAVLTGHSKEVRCVAWSPDGKVIATGSHDPSIRLWTPDGKPLQSINERPDWVLSVRFTADSTALLYSWGGNKPGVFGAALWEIPGGRERMRFTRHTNSVMCGDLSPDGTLAATSGGNDQETFLWNTADGTPTQRLAGRGRGAFSAAWSPDGTTIAWGHTNQGGQLKAANPLERAFRLAGFEYADAPDASFRRAQFARGSLALESVGESRVAIKRANDTVATFKAPKYYGQIYCFTLLPGDHAAVGTYFRLHLIDTRTGKSIREFLAHTGIVWAVAPSPNGHWLLSASNDMTLRLWDPNRDESLLSFFFAGDDWVAWTPEGYYATSPGGESLMGWHVNQGKDQMAEFFPAAQFRKSLYRPDVVKLIPTTGSVERALEVADAAKGKASERVEVVEVLPPLVAIDAPLPGATLSAARLEVKAVARARGGRPVTALRLLLDGRPYRGQAGVVSFDPPRAGEARASWDVALAPEAERALTVQAESAVSNALSDPVEVTYTPMELPKVTLPSLYVLAVGVSDYPGDLKLHYAAQDAEAVERAFRDRSGPLFKTVEVKRLTDKGATRKDVLAGLTWLRKQMTQHDVGIVFFSGHGMRDAEGSLYLLPIDADPDDLLATAVGDDTLKKALAGMPGRVVALLDACHAGAAGGDRRKGGDSLTDDLVRDLATDDYGVIVMASSTGRESSLENNAGRQGSFTMALVEGLSGKADYNHDQIVYLSELDTYVAERVKELTKGQQHPVTAKPTSIRSFPLAKP